MRYRKSAFLQTIGSFAGFKGIYHSYYGSAMVLNNEYGSLLDRFSTPRSLAGFEGRHSEFLHELIHRDFLVAPEISERERIMGEFDNPAPTTFSGLSLDVAAGCNFDCYHCIHSAGNTLDARSRRPARMSFESARLAIDWVAKDLIENGETEIAINLNGGEPLLNWPMVAAVLEYVWRRYRSRLGVRFSLNTNSSLMTREVVGTLRRYNVDIGTSLDGAKAANDSVRQTRRGGPTLERILAGFRKLAEGGVPVSAVHVTISSKNFDQLDESFIEFLLQSGIKNVTIDPDLTDRLRQPVSSLVERIMELRKLARRKGMSITGYWERPFANIFRGRKNLQSHFCGSTAGRSIDILPDGSIYSCSFTNRKHGYLKELAAKGSTKDFINSPSFQAMIESRRVGRIQECRGCEIEGVCGGGCYVTNAHAQQKGDNAITTYRCDFYRQITRRLSMEMIEQYISPRTAGARINFYDIPAKNPLV